MAKTNTTPAAVAAIVNDAAEAAAAEAAAAEAAAAEAAAAEAAPEVISSEAPEAAATATEAVPEVISSEALTPAQALARLEDPEAGLTLGEIMELEKIAVGAA